MILSYLKEVRTPLFFLEQKFCKKYVTPNYFEGTSTKSVSQIAKKGALTHDNSLSKEYLSTSRDARRVCLYLKSSSYRLTNTYRRT